MSSRSSSRARATRLRIASVSPTASSVATRTGHSSSNNRLTTQSATAASIGCAYSARGSARDSSTPAHRPSRERTHWPRTRAIAIDRSAICCSPISRLATPTPGLGRTSRQDPIRPSFRRRSARPPRASGKGECDRRRDGRFPRVPVAPRKTTAATITKADGAWGDGLRR